MAHLIDKDAVVAEIERLIERAKDVDLDKEIDLVEDRYHGFESLSRSDIIEIAKHFFEFGIQQFNHNKNEEKKENNFFAILTNTKTGKIFRAKSVKANNGVFTVQRHIDPSVTIVAENIKDSIPVIGRKIISDLQYVVKKKDIIGDNEKLHVAVFDSNEIMQYDFYIYNAWIQDVNEETNTIVLNCDYIS